MKGMKMKNSIKKERTHKKLERFRLTASSARRTEFARRGYDIKPNRSQSVP